VERPFSWRRVMANREYRAALGVALGLGLLAAIKIFVKS
jgi:hypothetical protein